MLQYSIESIVGGSGVNKEKYKIKTINRDQIAKILKKKKNRFN